MKLAMAFVLLAAPAFGVEYVYGPAHSDNGVMGLGQWLIAGRSANLSDGDDSTGVFYPETPNIYGGPVSGAFGVRARDDGRISLYDTIQEVKVIFRVKGQDKFQTFVHRDTDSTDEFVWGELSWKSFPWFHSPASWVKDQWTTVTSIFEMNGLGLPWRADGLFKNCFGICSKRGGFYLSEWRLVVTVLPNQTSCSTGCWSPSGRP